MEHEARCVECQGVAGREHLAGRDDAQEEGAVEAIPRRFVEAPHALPDARDESGPRVHSGVVRDLVDVVVDEGVVESGPVEGEGEKENHCQAEEPRLGGCESATRRRSRLGARHGPPRSHRHPHAPPPPIGV